MHTTRNTRPQTRTAAPTHPFTHPPGHSLTPPTTSLNLTPPGNRNKDLVIVNVKDPDMPPNHRIHVTIDESKAGIANMPLPLKVNGLLRNTTNVNMVSLPPIAIPDLGTIVTVDARHNSTAPQINLQLPQDVQVVSVTLPDPPKIGRDVKINMPGVDLNRFVPAGIFPGDDGGLNLTTTVIDAKLPSFNVIPALNKPLIKPGSFAIGTKGNGAGKGAWGVRVSVEDQMTGGSPLSPIQIGGPLAPDSAIGIVRDAIMSGIESESGQFCNNRCCPACKPRPVKLEYAAPTVKCPPGCDGTAAGGQCVCKAAEVAACPAGKVACDTAAGAQALCIDASMHAIVCKPFAAICSAKKQLMDC